MKPIPIILLMLLATTPGIFAQEFYRQQLKLNGPLVLNDDVQSVHIIPNGSTMVSRADQDTDQVFELYSVPIGGRPSTGRSIFHSRAATHAACILDISRRHLM